MPYLISTTGQAIAWREGPNLGTASEREYQREQDDYDDNEE